VRPAREDQRALTARPVRAGSGASGGLLARPIPGLWRRLGVI
jgi:hypothetical protein